MLEWVDMMSSDRYRAYFAGPGADPIVFVGRTDGIIVPARGEAVFGWGEPCPFINILPLSMAYAIRSNESMGLLPCDGLTCVAGLSSPDTLSKSSIHLTPQYNSPMQFLSPACFIEHACLQIQSFSQMALIRRMQRWTKLSRIPSHTGDARL